MKRQDGYLTKESGAWLGHYSRWITDYSTGERKRQQRAFKIGPVSMTKTQARDKLRERIVSELSITADSRVTLGWFIENRWLPLHVGSWRDSTKAVNRELLKFILDRFGSTPVEDLDARHGWEKGRQVLGHWASACHWKTAMPWCWPTLSRNEWQLEPHLSPTISVSRWLMSWAISCFDRLPIPTRASCEQDGFRKTCKKPIADICGTLPRS